MEKYLPASSGKGGFEGVDVLVEQDRRSSGKLLPIFHSEAEGPASCAVRVGAGPPRMGAACGGD